MANPTGKDLRCAPRTRGELKRALIRICPTGQRSTKTGADVGATLIVHVRDCSCRGLALIHTEPLEPGTQFLIELHRRSEVVRRLLYVVARCRPSDHRGRTFLIGARFVCLAERQPSTIDVDVVESIRRAILA